MTLHERSLSLDPTRLPPSKSTAGQPQPKTPVPARELKDFTTEETSFISPQRPGGFGSYEQLPVRKERAISLKKPSAGQVVLKVS